jgi:hypothetical protein
MEMQWIERDRHLERHRRIWKDIIKKDHVEVGCDCVELFVLLREV